MSESTRIKLEVINHIAMVTLSRPAKRNALDMDMFKAIVRTIKKLTKDKTIRAVILSGEGEDFCSGLDVKSMMKSSTGPLKLLIKILPWRSNIAQKVSTGWQKIPVPVITVIHGRCWGGGLHIALGADIRIAEPGSTFSIMEGRWGMIPDMGGLIPIRQHCRIDVAKELTMTSKIIDTDTAQQAGLVTYISDDAMIMAQELAEEISAQSPDSVAAVKKLYNKSWHGSKGMVLLRETFYQLKVLMGKNAKIKSYNQTHDADKQKAFLPRKKW